MKLFSKVVGIAVVLGLFSVSPVLAKMGDKEVNVGLAYGSAPASGFGSAIGFSIGGGYEIQDNIQVRADISSFGWKQTVSGLDAKYTRMPITVSGRKYYPLQNNLLKAYGQLGLEMSMDKVDVVIPGYTSGFFSVPAQTASASETRLGITPGGGIEFAVTPQISVGGNVAYHIITDSYFTLGINAGYHIMDPNFKTQ